jgi:hypothetical protein
MANKKKAEPAPEKVRPEEVPADSPLAQAEAHRARYEQTGDPSDYNQWKFAEQAHLTSNT